METEKILKELNRVKSSFNLYERRPGKYQLMAPILHEDGDMLDIYFQKSPKGKNHIRICDFGMALQRLSYTYEINTPSKKKVFNSILLNNGIKEDNGNLYLDSSIDKIYEGVQQFAGCVQKICSMDYWSRETASAAFYENLKIFVSKNLREFSPEPDFAPFLNQEKQKIQQGYENLKADWLLKWKKRQFYLFGVKGNNKANKATIALLEFKKANLLFTSLIVHEDMSSLSEKESKDLTRNADKQYPNLNDFNQEGAKDIKRLAS